METPQLSSCSGSALFAASRKQLEVKKWDGSGRTDICWDALRKDNDLWFSDGDCHVYLYSKGMSKRGPSFCIPYPAVRAGGCDISLLADAHISSSGRSSPTNSSDGSSAGGSSVDAAKGIELFLGAPSLERDQKMHWHITTRNFFAWLFGKPLVGEDLGLTIERLLERLRKYRGDAIDNVQGVLDYAQKIGYLSFVDRPDHALAMLSFAESHHIQTLYVDAFAHCVGMKDKLATCSGYKHISSLSKALITRAHLEMDLHVERAAISLGNFMDEELSTSHLGLSKGARIHLDTFRSFLHTYCVAKYGYWPQSSSYSRTLYQSMHKDFKALYTYLANKEHDKDSHVSQPATGGICVLQNLEAFNERHRYQPLPYPTPLMPVISAVDDAVCGHRNKRSSWFGFGNNSQSEIQRVEVVRSALSFAANFDDAVVVSCPLVQAYQQFEKEQTSACDEDISVTDARKVRWILIYAMLQTISSITHAPPEVKQATVTPYPLCCLTTGTPPWKTSSVVDRPLRPTTPLREESNVPTPSTLGFDIHPDCESHDYFHFLPKHTSGPVYQQPNPSTGFHRPLSVASSRSFHMSLHRTSMRSSSTGHIAPPPLPLQYSEGRRFTLPSRQSNTKPHRHTLSHPLRIETSYSGSTIPALEWSPDLLDRTESSSDDETSASDTDRQIQFPSFDPYHPAFIMPTGKPHQDLEDTKVRNSLDTLLDDFFNEPLFLTGMAL